MATMVVRAATPTAVRSDDRGLLLYPARRKNDRRLLSRKLLNDLPRRPRPPMSPGRRAASSATRHNYRRWTKGLAEWLRTRHHYWLCLSSRRRINRRQLRLSRLLHNDWVTPWTTAPAPAPPTAT